MGTHARVVNSTLAQTMKQDKETGKRRAEKSEYGKKQNGLEINQPIVIARAYLPPGHHSSKQWMNYLTVTILT